MQIITLTTDMGISDYYVAALKGTIYSQIPSATIVDISHSIKAFDIVQGSYALKSVLNDFPAGTIHIFGIDSEPVINARDGRYPAIMELNGQIIISNDNGVFELLLNETSEPTGFWLIDDALSNLDSVRFPVKNCFIPTAAKLLSGAKIDDIASKHEQWTRAFSINPVLEENLIKGSVIHIDHFGNAITNISKKLFERFPVDIPFTIHFRKKDYYIDTISGSYNEVAHGERVAIFNQGDLLEIAINKGAKDSNGGADSLFGLHVGDVIRVEFTPRGSATTIDSLF